MRRKGIPRIGPGLRGGSRLLFASGRKTVPCHVSQCSHSRGPRPDSRAWAWTAQHRNLRNPDFSKWTRRGGRPLSPSDEPLKPRARLSLGRDAQDLLDLRAEAHEGRDCADESDHAVVERVVPERARRDQDVERVLRQLVPDRRLLTAV